MRPPKSLAKYSAKELLTCGAVFYRQSESDTKAILKKLQEQWIDTKMKENLKMQGLIIEANKTMTGPAWMRNHHKLDGLFAEFDKLTKLSSLLSSTATDDRTPSGGPGHQLVGRLAP